MPVLNVVKKFFPKVTHVLDAKTPAFIEVTTKDASSKAVKDHNACAMAVACKRKFKLDGVIISRSIAYLVKGKQARRFKLPESVSREIVSFDRGAGFQPGKYTLEAVYPSMRQNYKSKRPSGPHTDNKVKRVRHLTTNVRSVLSGERPED